MMRALLKKDYTVMKKNYKMFLLILLLFVFAGTIKTTDEFFVIFPLVLSSALVVSLISYDEHTHFDSYSCALPVSRKLAVTEKYAVSVIMTGGIFIICLAGMCMRMTVGSPEFLTELFIMLIVALLPPSVLLPTVFKLGAEKSRLYYYLIILAGVGVSYLSSEILAHSADFKTTALPAIVAAVILVPVYCYSWKLSVRYYEAREL